MLDLNRIDFSDTKDLKEVRKLKKSDLLKLFKNPEVVKGLTKKDLLEILLDNKFFVTLRRRLFDTNIKIMNLNMEISKLKGTEKAKKYLDLEDQYQEVVRKYKSLKHSKDVYTEKLEKDIRELNSKIHELERDRDYYKNKYFNNFNFFGNNSNTNSIDFKPYYRKLAMYLHPDKQGGNSEGMQILNELKEKLK